MKATTALLASLMQHYVLVSFVLDMILRRHFLIFKTSIGSICVASSLRKIYP